MWEENAASLSPSPDAKTACQFALGALVGCHSWADAEFTEMKKTVRTTVAKQKAMFLMVIEKNLSF